MTNSKIVSLATAALELSKMVLIITANTTCKLVSVGKSEIVKQYEEYQRKATPQQRAAIGAFKELTSKGTQVAKAEMQKLEQAKKKAQQKIEEQTDKGKKK